MRIVLHALDNIPPRPVVFIAVAVLVVAYLSRI